MCSHPCPLNPKWRTEIGIHRDAKNTMHSFDLRLTTAVAKLP
jgi:hypothetical protein